MHDLPKLKCVEKAWGLKVGKVYTQTRFKWDPDLEDKGYKRETTVCVDINFNPDDRHWFLYHRKHFTIVG